MVCDHVGDNMFLCHIGEVMVVIEKVVDEYDDRVYKMAKVVTKFHTQTISCFPGKVSKCSPSNALYNVALQRKTNVLTTFV